MMLLALGDAIEESRRLIEILEQQGPTLPLAAQLLAAHRPAHQALELHQAQSEQAVAAWRSALAVRWECEVRGRRVFKQIYHQLVEHYGSVQAPEVQVLSREGAEVDSTPAELLGDLRRLRAHLALHEQQLAFAAERLLEIDEACAALERAIAETAGREATRRAAVINRRLAQEAYRRLRGATREALIEHTGADIVVDLGATDVL